MHITDKNIDTNIQFTNLNLRFEKKTVDYVNNGSFYYMGKPLKFKYNKTKSNLKYFTLLKIKIAIIR